MSAPDYYHFLGETRVEELMGAATPWPKIIKILSEEGLTQSREVAKEWRDKVLTRWKVEEDEARPHRKAIWRTRLETLYYELHSRAVATKNDLAAVKFFGEALRAADACIALDGVSAPIQIQHGGTVGVAVESMAPIERQREIEELLERRRLAHARPILAAEAS
jgi:hypothetical protein